jgi:hypothetical protein
VKLPDNGFGAARAAPAGENPRGKYASNKLF